MIRLLLLTLGLVFSGCVPRAASPMPPRLELVQLNLLSLDPGRGVAQFELKLRMVNPNRMGLLVQDSAVTAELGSASVSFGLPGTDLPAAGMRELRPAVLTVPVVGGPSTQTTGPLVQGSAALAALSAGNEVRLRLLGEVRAQVGAAVGPLGPATLLDTKVKLSLGFTPPAIRVVTWSLDGQNMIVAFESRNPNKTLGFAVQGLVRPQLNGQDFGQGYLNTYLAPGQTKRDEVRLSLTGLPGTGIVLVCEFKAQIPGILDRSAYHTLKL